jgi:polysaccharide biosynthesis transport protein
MTPRQVLSVLAARWPWALAVLLICVVATATVSMTMLKRYTASASVMLDARSPDQVAGGAPNSSLPGGYMGTQMDLIASERVGRAVIRSLGLSNDPGLREAWQQAGGGQGDFEAWLSEVMQKNLSVRPAPVSNVLTVAYTSDDGAKAADIANAYVKAYIDVSLELRMERVHQYGSFFDARAKELRADLERAREKLSAYQQQNGLIVGDEKLDIESSRLAELGVQLLAAQTANADVASRVSQAGRQTDQLQEVWQNPAVAALAAEVTREEVRLGEMTSRLGESHPQRIEQEVRLSELRARLEAEKGRAARNVSFGNSATRARVSQISSALEAQRAKVLRMQSQREQSGALQREFESAQRAFDAMQQRVQQAGIETQNTFTNLSILKQATVPMAPSSPNLVKNIGASIALGTLLGLGLVLGREQLDRRIRTVDDVSELKQVFLVSLPVSAHAKRALPDTSRTKLMKERVLTGLPRPTQQTT